MTRSERCSIARMHLIAALAYPQQHDFAAALRVWLASVPARGPVVIVCAADDAGTSAQDGGGGSSKRPLVTRRDLVAALDAHADIIPESVRARIVVRTLADERSV